VTMANPSQLRSSFSPNLTYSLLDQIGKTIVTGGYDRRPFPTEAELSTQHAVSRSVTREAVKMLTAKGLLKARPRTGTIVQPEASWNLFDPDVLRWLLDRKFSLTLLRQFGELRLALEPAAAALAADIGDLQKIEAIAQGYKRMETAERGEDDPLDADIAFHVGILEASGNPFFYQLRDVVATALRTSIRFTNQMAGHTADLAAHRAVLKAIEAKDAAGARRAMSSLLGDTMALIKQADEAAKQPARKRASRSR
jgi:DNA-binding FadR family transcriptional regulator